MSKKSLSRRNFLKTAVITIAASTVTCTGLGYLATIPPTIQTPVLEFRKETTMTKRILVTYATRAGSTAEIAAAIGEALNKRGYMVDVMPVKSKPALENYQAVIMGSAIRMGSWLPEMVSFVKANQQMLNQMPTASFTVHMLNAGEDDSNRAARLAYLDAVRPLLPDLKNEFFTGAMDFSRLSLIDRLISSMVKAVESDSRDWQKIQAWAEMVFA